MFFDDYGTAVDIYEAPIHSIIHNGQSMVYSMNMLPNALPIPSSLTDLPYNINININKDLESCIGINVPTYYLGGHHSFTEIHPAHGYLDSANAMHWSVECAWKGWLIVHPDDNKILCELVPRVFKELKKEENTKMIYVQHR